jgi:hypothetical protein
LNKIVPSHWPIEVDERKPLQTKNLILLHQTILAKAFFKNYLLKQINPSMCYIQFRKISLLICLLGISFLIQNCKDKEDPAPSKKELLTAHEWKFSSIDLSSSLDITTKSFITGLYTGGKYTFDSNGNYTITLLSIPDSGKWEFTSNDTKIVFDKGTADEFAMDIVTLSASNLDLKGNDTDHGGEFTVRYTK